MKPCIHCQTPLPDEAVFCFQCGKEQIQPEKTAVGSGAKVCPRCQTPIAQAGIAFCQACGFPLAQPAAVPTPLPVPPPLPQPAPGPVVDYAPPKEKASLAGTQPAELPKAPKLGQVKPVPAPQPKPPEPKSGGVKQKPRKSGLIFAGAAVLLMAVVIVFIIWQPWPPDHDEEMVEEVVQCRPADIPEDYEAANQSDLEGDLRRDSYFIANEEYTIAPNATFRIPAGRTLIIEPGVRVRFGEGSKLVVEGTLLACGKSSRRILFNADTEAGRLGYWSGIELVDADPETVIGHANVEFAGSDNHAAIWVQGSSVQLEDIAFNSNQWYALSFDPNSEPKLRSPFEVENGPQGWEVRGGDLTGGRTWDFTPLFVVNGVVKITEDATLNLPAGATVKFLPASGFQVFGSLNAAGTGDQKILLTSAYDGGEAGSKQPEAGDWVGVVWSGRQGNSNLTHVEVKYAGGQAVNGRVYGCLIMEDAAPALASVRVLDCGSYALSTDLSSAPQIDDLSLDSEDPLKRWELRESQVEGVNTYTLSSLETADGARLDPYVTGWLGVAESATLVIDADTHLLFSPDHNSGIWADGIITINGTDKKQVIMTSARDPQVGGAGQPSAGDWGGLHINHALPEETVISWLEMRYAGATDNTCLRLQDASPLLDNISIAHCASYPISSFATAQPVIENLSLIDNALGNVWEIQATNMTERRTWLWEPVALADESLLVRRITGRILVDKEATLELSPGLALGFGPEGYLLVRGGIQASGTLDEPILLTSWRDATINPEEGGAQPGDWPGLGLDGAREGQILQHLSIRYAGSTSQDAGCLSLNKASPVVDNVEVSHCSSYPISSDMNSNPQIGAMTLTDNQLGNAWVIRDSSLEQGNTRHWQAIAQVGGGDNLTRLVTGWLTIDTDATLVLEPGVVLRFTSGRGMVVNGSLQVEGTQQEPVVFTSWRDPEFSNEGGVQAGDWTSLRLDNPQGQVNLDGLEIRYAGSGEGALKLTNAAPSLERVLIRDSAGYPLSLDLQSNPQWGEITLVNNSPANAAEIRSSHLERAGELIWSPVKLADGSDLIRLVTGWLYIAENAMLRVDPQTVLKFTPEGGLEVRGGLTTNQAVFTSFQDADFGGLTDGGVGGDLSWQGIRLLSQRPVMLQNTTIRYAQTGIWMENASPVFSGVRIDHCFAAALSADLASAPRFDDVTLVDNPINGMLIRATALPDGETNWERLGDGDQVVRVMLETLTIGPDAQLAIGEGVVLKFGSQVSLVVEGRLTVAGSETSPVIFTAVSDDSAGGDSDQSSLPPNRGTWGGLLVNPNQTAAVLALTNAEIRYAVNGIFLVNMPLWTYDGLVISDSLFYGISCDALSAFTLDENIIFLNNGSETLSCPTPDR